MKRHIILVGLPGAGKTTIGHMVAARLRAPFVDLDEAIERRADRSIAQIFAQDGEGAFRVLEREELERALAAPAGVIAAGGGWAAQPGNLEAVAGRALTVYLKVPPEEVARRVAPTADSRPPTAGRREPRAESREPRAESRQPTADSRQPTADSRPLLAGGEVALRVQELYAARRSSYERCEATVAAGAADPGSVAREVAQLARRLAGWY